MQTEPISEPGRQVSTKSQPTQPAAACADSGTLSGPVNCEHSVDECIQPPGSGTGLPPGKRFCSRCSSVMPGRWDGGTICRDCRIELELAAMRDARQQCEDAVAAKEYWNER